MPSLSQPASDSLLFLPKDGLDELVAQLRREGYTVIGTREVDGVVRLAEIDSAEQLVKGRRDRQDGGFYRLEAGDEAMYFQHVVGPDAPKRWFFPPHQRLFTLHVEGDRFVLDAGGEQPPKLALLGIRPCELAAIAIQDRAFGAGDKDFRCEQETYYRQTRQAALLIVVNCTESGGTCFCASMHSGPEAREGFDLALTELRSGFVLSIGSSRGQQLADRLPMRMASPAEVELAQIKLQRSADHMGRRLKTQGLRETLCRHIDHPHWDDIAQRCLGCGNCTMVCPTCFCSSVMDHSDLSGVRVTRTRQWESCFTHQFSYTTAGPVRNTIRSRYRHWLRHKLATWWDQFGTSGCVGCGRCITWCPVGIDLTREIEYLRDGAGASASATENLP